MGERVHRTAERGFTLAAEVYERARPGYPEEAVAWVREALGLGPGRTLVELGAGTGKLTRLLLPTGATIVAVEPVAAMRAQLTTAVPGPELVDGTAEATGLPGASADAVVAAQAFHWFDVPRALDEIHRLLRPGGRLGLIWNNRDQASSWMAELTRIVDAAGDHALRYRNQTWRPPLEADARFGPLRERHFPHHQAATPELLIERVASTSFVATLEPERREALLERIRDLVRTHPDLRGKATFTIPYRTEVYDCARVEPARASS